MRRTFRPAPSPAEGDIRCEPLVDPTALSPLLDDFQARLSRLTPNDARPALLERAQDPATVKAVWRSHGGEVLGAAFATVEGTGAEIVFMHVGARFASAAATGRLLGALLGGLAPSVVRVRAMDRFAHRWLHLPPADTRSLLLANGFLAFDRVLLTRDLRRPIAPPPPLPAGFSLGRPDPTRIEAFSAFAYSAYRGTTDFAIIAPDASPQAYERLYRRFLSGELGPYAEALSLEALAPDGAIAGVLHAIFVGPEPYVGDLSVAPEVRGKGVGRHLLLAGLAAFRGAGYLRTALTVTAQNTPAYNLYRSAGFEVERSAEVYLLTR